MASPATFWTPELIEFTRGEAVSAGFDLAGVAEAFASEQDAGRLTAERFTAWIDEGRAGEMEYLKRRDEHGELLRRSVRVALPWARSVVVCAFNYNAAGPRSLDPAAAGDGWIARYAWNGTESGEPTDYHDDLLARLRAVETALHDVAECETRCYVDTGPLLERDLAAKAGVGWVGKNTCVLNQKIGSWMLLGVIVTSLPLGPGLSVEEAADRCGSCTRCIDACPTDALVAPRQMDASLCIAYLTIEKKGSIAEELREPMGRQVFGCDICQEVCPWNRRAPVSVRTGLATRDELINPALEWLGAMEQDEFRRRFRGSPLERTKLKRLRRNVAIAMGNSGEQGFRPRLAEWAAAEDEVLAEAASWALGRLAVKETED
ncbi:tRNA epoxyqueuosine(34) reductase QueG [Granulicella sp. WH15]|uniref:tRNA epoxyqueuosine(34) reductase QueG n=1 Tax=Granulicella sp. WH15 TaxID=2602070 RepID=UPI00210245C0|nr:tRNA epoxyqueuosine(34) reductase QueG [Granulicella sp. WH15]